MNIDNGAFWATAGVHRAPAGRGCSPDLRGGRDHACGESDRPCHTSCARRLDASSRHGMVTMTPHCFLPVVTRFTLSCLWSPGLPYPNPAKGDKGDKRNPSDE